MPIKDGVDAPLSGSGQGLCWCLDWQTAVEASLREVYGQVRKAIPVLLVHLKTLVLGAFLCYA